MKNNLDLRKNASINIIFGIKLSISILKKRTPEIVVISDVHLGTFGCHATELLEYLNNIKPRKLILNGDIIDIWQFRKSYFPKSHLEVIKKIIDLKPNGTEVIYITGNHDEMFWKFSDSKLRNFTIVDKLVLDLDGKKARFFHGDFLMFPSRMPGGSQNLAVGGITCLYFLTRCLTGSWQKQDGRDTRFPGRLKTVLREQ